MKTFSQFLVEDMSPDEARRVLGVSRGAIADEIKAAFRELAKQHHPDRGGDERKMQDVTSAYRVLTTRRSSYVGGSTGDTSPSPPPPRRGGSPDAEPFKKPGFFDAVKPEDRKHVEHLLALAHAHFTRLDARGLPKTLPALVTTTGRIVGFEPFTVDILKHVAATYPTLTPYRFQFQPIYKSTVGMPSGTHISVVNPVLVWWDR